MTGSASAVPLGKHLEELALAAKRYTLEELLILSSAISSELAGIELKLFSASDLAYIFSGSCFTKAEMNYIFSNNDSSSAFTAEELNYIFSNSGTAPSIFSEPEINYIFS